jgi:mannosyltransferase OCH1-like enzyme|tara:strand:- start:401 stop:961 length:561 start_codon:yes stop_codon:yes gene_type:complete
LNKVIHIIWIGDVPFPRFCNRSYEHHNPGWAVKVWTDDNIPKLYNQEIYDKVTHPAYKADIARLEILYEYGGLYVDADTVCLKPLDLPSAPFTSTGNYGNHCMSVIGFEAGDTLMGDVVHDLMDNVEKTEENNTHSMAGTKYVRPYWEKVKKIPREVIGSVLDMNSNMQIMHLYVRSWENEKQWII